MLFNLNWKPLDAISQTFLRAADYMERYGWCRFHHELIDGSTCPLGAIRRVGWEYAEAAGNRLNEYLRMSPSYWNDFICETKEQAVAMLRKAAVEAK